MSDIVERLQAKKRNATDEEDDALDEILLLRQRVKELEGYEQECANLDAELKDYQNCLAELATSKQMVKELEFKIECLELSEASFKDSFDKTYEELAALKQSQSEPVAWLNNQTGSIKAGWDSILDQNNFTPLYTAAPAIPEGWQIVPIEPTDIHFVQLYMREHGLEVSEWMVKTMHHALLAAAHKPEDVK